MAPAKNPYSVHPATGMARKWAEGLEKETGRSLAAWVALVRREGPADLRERRAWLRSKHRLPVNVAWLVAERAEGRASIMGEEEAYLADVPRMVEAQYAGPKAALRPIYDRLLATLLSLGRDVKACPCKTMVPFYRRHAFAEIHATTNTRVDLHLALGDVKPSGRLERLRTPAAQRVGHRIRLGSPADIDGEVLARLREAYAAGDAAIRRKVSTKVPAELAAALKKSAKARAAFDALAPGHRAAWIRFVDEAKKAETRAKRVARAVERLAAGKKTTY